MYKSKFRYQSIFILLLILLNIPSLLTAALNEPFGVGYTMANFGTIIQENRLSGRQPWIPACFANDTILFSLSSAYVNYYDAMDNLQDSDFRQSAFGFWLNFKWIGIKGCGIFFNALGIYHEQKGYLSLGTSLIPHLNISVEFEALRVGLINKRQESETLASAGISALIPWSFVSVSLSCKNFILKDVSKEGIKQPIALSLGIHTIPHRFGSQGMVLTVEPENNNQLKLYIGEEIFIHKMVGFSLGVSTKPLMIGFGIVFLLPTYGLYTSFVHHPLLGWSQGVGAEYVRRER